MFVPAQVDGVVAIHPGHKDGTEPTFHTFDDCMAHYCNTAAETTGLAAKPTGCIAIPANLKQFANPSTDYVANPNHGGHGAQRHPQAALYKADTSGAGAQGIQVLPRRRAGRVVDGTAGTAREYVVPGDAAPSPLYAVQGSSGDSADA